VTNPAPSQLPANSSFGALELRDYLEIFHRRRLPLILCAMGFLIFGIVFAERQSDYYRSETMIMVDPQQVPSNYVQSTVSTSIQDRLSTIQEQVMSASRLQHIIDTFGLYPELRKKRSEQQIVAMMRKATVVDVANSGERRLSAFRIGFQSGDPKVAAKVANELAAQFIEENVRARLEQFNGAANFLDSELTDTKKQLEEKEHELQLIKSQNALDLPESRQYHMETLNNLRNQLRSTQDRISQAHQQKLLLKQYAPTVDLDSGGEGPSISPTQSRIQKLESRLSELRAHYGPGHPDVRKVEAELADAREQRAIEEKQQESLAPPKPAPITPSRARNPVLVAEEQKLDQEITDQTKLQKQLEEQINFHTNKLEQGPVFEQRIASLMRDYDNLRGHYSSLLDKKFSAEMARELEGRQQGERFVILDAAPVPQSPAGPNRLLIVAGSFILGVLAGTALVLVIEFSDESVRTEREATKLLGKSVLVSVPHVMGTLEKRKKQLWLTGAFAGTALGAALLAYAVTIFGAALI
jgi:succinoglycan biosynthesis transport protein ExoP